MEWKLLTFQDFLVNTIRADDMNRVSLVILILLE